jgi:hypothetical protein
VVYVVISLSQNLTWICYSTVLDSTKEHYSATDTQINRMVEVVSFARTVGLRIAFAGLRAAKSCRVLVVVVTTSVLTANQSTTYDVRSLGHITCRSIFTSCCYCNSIAQINQNTRKSSLNIRLKSLGPYTNNFSWHHQPLLPRHRHHRHCHHLHHHHHRHRCCVTRSSTHATTRWQAGWVFLPAALLSNPIADKLGLRAGVVVCAGLIALGSVHVLRF